MTQTEYRITTVRAIAARPAQSTLAWQNERLEVPLRSLGSERTEMTFSDVWEGKPLDAEESAATQASWNAWLDRLEAIF